MYQSFLLLYFIASQQIYGIVERILTKSKDYITDGKVIFKFLLSHYK